MNNPTTVNEPNFVILYVKEPLISAAFYAALLERQPVESSPTFVMFALSSGLMLGLWARSTVEPETEITGGGQELAFAVSDKASVLHHFQTWQKMGLPILQSPVAMDFGFTFTAHDPDHHRLRVFAAGGA